MGYYAELVQGVDIVVAFPSKTMDAIALWEHEMNSVKDHVYQHVHMSWCSPVADYRKRCDGDDQSALVAMLTDFGFYASARPLYGAVIVEGWGGDKIGSTFLEMFQALARGTTKDVDWMFRGEDGEYFAMCITGNVDDDHVGDAHERSVHTEYTIIK